MRKTTTTVATALLLLTAATPSHAAMPRTERQAKELLAWQGATHIRVSCRDWVCRARFHLPPGAGMFDGAHSLSDATYTQHCRTKITFHASKVEEDMNDRYCTSSAAPRRHGLG